MCTTFCKLYAVCESISSCKTGSSFLDGSVHAYEFLGGVPTEDLLDNLKTTVLKILQDRDRLEQEAFIGLQAHYVVKAEFSNPTSGNEKGRVEGTVGYVRRNALVPYPEV